MFHGRLSYGRSSDVDMPHVAQFPLLTNGQMDDNIPPVQHALVPSFMRSAKRIHPLPFSNSVLPGIYSSSFLLVSLLISLFL